MFGREPRPYKDSYNLQGKKIREKNGVLLVDCDRCNRFTEEIKEYKIHTDGAVSFSFYCRNCFWTYSIYRNGYAEHKQVARTLRN